jgi:hypothetical protein
LGMKKFSRGWVPHFLSPIQKGARVEASTEMLWILHESEENHFEGTATADESRFQYSYPFSKMCGRSPTDAITRTQQAIGKGTIMIMIFVTGGTLIVLGILPKGSKFN